MESMLACRAGDLDLLLPFKGMERIVPWFDVEHSGDHIRWIETEIPLIRLDDCLGVSSREPPLNAGVAILRVYGERMAVLADRFLGLVDVDLEDSFRVPLKWILDHPGLPYRAFHMNEGRMLPEVAPYHLLIKSVGEGTWPVAQSGITACSGRYLSITVDDVAAAVPIDAVEHVVDGESLIVLPGLPGTILGVLQVQGRPIPVSPALPGMTSATAIVILRCSAGLLGLAVDATNGMVELSEIVEESDHPGPPFIGGCGVLDHDLSGGAVFTLDPERIWGCLGG